MSDSAGYVKLHRKIVDWEWYQNPNTFRVFLHLLLIANYIDGRFEGKEIKRGQVVTSLPSLAKQTCLSVQQVRTALDHLKSTGEITDESSRQYRLITIVKYNDYQKDNRPNNRRATDDQQTSNRRPTDEQQQYKNNNKGRREEGKNDNISPSSIYDMFEMFWKRYPRKVAKQDAERAWNKIWKNQQETGLFNEIIFGLEAWKRSDEWQRDDGRYIPHPATWLNGRRWEDEVKPGKGDSGKAPTKVMPANNFDQRDYSDVDHELMSQLAKDMAVFNRQGGQ